MSLKLICEFDLNSQTSINFTFEKSAKRVNTGVVKHSTYCVALWPDEVMYTYTFLAFVCLLPFRMVFTEIRWKNYRIYA